MRGRGDRGEKGEKGVEGKKREKGRGEKGKKFKEGWEGKGRKVEEEGMKQGVEVCGEVVEREEKVERGIDGNRKEENENQR